MDAKCCEGTWPSKPQCRAWVPEGWGWHGCKRAPEHQGTCKCRCGAVEYGRASYSTRQRQRQINAERTSQ